MNTDKTHKTCPKGGFVGFVSVPGSPFSGIEAMTETIDSIPTADELRAEWADSRWRAQMRAQLRAELAEANPDDLEDIAYTLAAIDVLDAQAETIRRMLPLANAAEDLPARCLGAGTQAMADALGMNLLQHGTPVTVELWPADVERLAHIAWGAITRAIAEQPNQEARVIVPIHG